MQWRERIGLAKKEGFTPQDKEDAGTFMACAVWEQRTRYGAGVIATNPDQHERPYDGTLYDLGIQFSAAVSNNQVEMAETVLDRIEDKALLLKRGK